MGAVQRLATMVIVGLVALSTILVLYLADESNRINAKEEELSAAAIERGTANYLSLCLSCHGPAGEGYEEGTGRIGFPLGGSNTSTNQQGINAKGTPVSGGIDARTSLISKTIHNGRANTLMPAWGDENGGPLNFDQINELVYFIQHVDWNEVYNTAVETSGGYPTVIPTPAPTSAAPTEVPPAGTFSIEMQDIKFAETTLTVPANTDITINLTNNGAGTHNFNIDALGVVSGDYAAGQTGTVTFNSGAPGEYEYYCAIPGHKEAGMVGKLIVTDQPVESAVTPATGAADAVTPAAGVTGAATPTTEVTGAVTGDTASVGDIEAGKLVAAQCIGCHSADGTAMVGPSWKGVYGSEVTLEDGTTLLVDEAYIIQSIKDPTSQIVKGFPPAMYSFAYLSDTDIANLVAYIKSLK